MSRSVSLWTHSKNWVIHHHWVVGTSSHKTSDAYAVYTKEKWYIENHIQSATAEREYMERRDTFPRSRCDMSWYSMSYFQIQVGYDRGLWANMHKTRGCHKNDILYNIRHLSEPSNANGRSPILKPVDFNTNESVWVITDGSWMGIGAMYGQGESWDTCQPAGFLSKKFMSTQHNYIPYTQTWDPRSLGSSHEMGG